VGAAELTKSLAPQAINDIPAGHYVPLLEFNHTALIVAIDDYVPFDSEADCAALDSLARSVLVPSLFGTNIRLLALEGSKQTHLVYQIA
jgi:hypothetical protein